MREKHDSKQLLFTSIFLQMEYSKREMNGQTMGYHQY